MSTTTYRWRDNTPWGGDPEPIANELERIRAERGALQTAFVVEEATAEDYSAPTGSEEGYEPLAVITAQPDRYLSALAEAQQGMANARKRVEELLSVARSTGHKKGEVARIMLAVQALETANEAIHALN